MEAPANGTVSDASAGGVADASEAVVRPSRPAAPSLADRLSWTYRQRRAMVLVLVLVLGIILWRTFKNPAIIPDPQPAEPYLYSELADRLDPNTAGWEELVAIPMLGEKRAQGIVAYREDWSKRHPGETAFQAPTDLAAVKGIGGSMIETISPYLVFPTKPATQSTQ